MTYLSTVAFDIETTGFQTTDQVTVIGFDADISSRVFLNVDERETPSSLNQRLDKEINQGVVLSTHNSEKALLEAMTDIVESSLRSQEIKLVAYNGETWRGGFGTGGTTPACRGGLRADRGDHEGRGRRERVSLMGLSVRYPCCRSEAAWFTKRKSVSGITASSASIHVL